MERRRRRRLHVAGVALIGAGVGVLGWVGWQWWGTTWVSQRQHDQIAAELQQEWRDGEQVVQLEEGPATALVEIPAFGNDYRVPLLEGTGEDALAAGFGHFVDTQAPGQVGNFGLAGHRTTHGEPLADMPDLQPGDKVVVTTADAIYTYVLDSGGDDLVVGFDETWVLDPSPVNPEGGVQPQQSDDLRSGQRLLTLVTCAELFHTDERLVAFGHLDSTTRR